ncbi:MAG: hypothetical protein ACRDYF_12530, partial [Acidimicrobiia bacterium]
MRERGFIHVTGPAGSGKTAFIEAVLATTDALILAARCSRDDALPEPQESASPTHPELRRYRHAGAHGAALFAFPETDVRSGEFFMTELMTDYSHAVVVEGDSPLVSVDLRVFVAPVPEVGEQLFVRRTRDRAAEERAKAAAFERLLLDPAAMADLLGEIGGAPLADFARNNPQALDDVRTRLLAARRSERTPRRPKPEQYWAIHDRFRGIEHAQLVIVNVRTDDQRARGEQLLSDLARLRTDEELCRDVLGVRGSRVPITAVVADLAATRDPGTRKALARVRRTIRSTS